MLVRRDGSIDFRILMGRVLSYGAVTALGCAYSDSQRLRLSPSHSELRPGPS